jgi:hypothetical protein
MAGEKFFPNYQDWAELGPCSLTAKDYSAEASAAAA